VLLVGEVGTVDDGEVVLGDDVGFAVLLCFGLTLVLDTVEGLSTVLAVGLGVTG
jgi:hypothetical protein